MNGIEKIIAIGAGKGGVGKSTVSVNLACALAEKGLRVGLLDADLYGPSIPIMMGLRGLSPRSSEDGKVIPFTKFGVHTISIGFFLEEAQSVLWRGPMLHKMLEKLLKEVAWPPLDVLLIDLPPGTGDVPLSLQKLVKLDGAIAVTTPQEVAVRDVIKALHAFEQLEIPLLGVVENFSRQNGREWKVPLLGKIPYVEQLREDADLGIPHSAPFTHLAQKLMEQVECGKIEVANARHNDRR